MDPFAIKLTLFYLAGCPLIFGLAWLVIRYEVARMKDNPHTKRDHKTSHSNLFLISSGICCLVVLLIFVQLLDLGFAGIVPSFSALVLLFTTFKAYDYTEQSLISQNEKIYVPPPGEQQTPPPKISPEAARLAEEIEQLAKR